VGDCHEEGGGALDDLPRPEADGDPEYGTGRGPEVSSDEAGGAPDGECLPEVLHRGRKDAPGRGGEAGYLGQRRRQSRPFF